MVDMLTFRGYMRERGTMCLLAIVPSNFVPGIPKLVRVQERFQENGINHELKIIYLE